MAHADISRNGRSALIGIAAALALAGCHKPPTNPPAPKLSHQDEQAEAAIDTAVAANTLAAMQTGLPVPKPMAAALKYALPPAFDGRWGITKADCDYNKLSRTGLLTIDSSTLNFYQSKANVMEIDRHSPYDVTVRLRIKGPGQGWSRVTEFKLDAAGTQLVRIARSPARIYRYRRC